MTKVIKLKESDIQRIVKRVITEDVNSEEKNDWGRIIGMFKNNFCEVYNDRRIPTTELPHHLRRYIENGISQIKKGEGVFGRIELTEDNIKWFTDNLEKEIRNTCVRDGMGSRIVSQTIYKLKLAIYTYKIEQELSS